MTITANGQVTIPQALRERYHLRPGTEVDFIALEDGLQIVPPKPHHHAPQVVASWLSKAQGCASTPLNTDQLMAMTRGEEW